MTKYREILRMASNHFSQHKIAETLHVSRNTIRQTLAKARAIHLDWPSIVRQGLEEEQVHSRVFTQKESTDEFFALDCPSIQRELGKTGVSLQILW